MALSGAAFPGYEAIAGPQDWSRDFAPPAPGGGDDYGWRAAPLPGGDIIVGGANNDGSNGQDMLVLRLDAGTGARLWERRFSSDSTADESIEAVVTDMAGRVVVAGRIQETAAADFFTAKLDPASGRTLWEKRFNGATGNTDGVRALVCAPNGDVIVSGYTWSGASFDIHTIRYASEDGAVLWQRTYGHPDNGEDVPVALAMDAAGDVLLTGYATTVSSGQQIYLCKLDGATGSVEWEANFGAPGSGNDLPRLMDVDSSGNVLITGASNNGANGDALTVRVSGTTGAILWARFHNGAANREDGPRGLAVASNGDAFVVISTQNATDYDILLTRYSAADGSTVWESTYAGIPGGNDLSRALVLDSNGNPVFTGNSSNGASFDIYTAAHSASTGARLWFNSYNGPGALDDVPWGMTLDSLGRPIVVGRTDRSGNEDLVAIAHSPADGARLWTQVYDGPSNHLDQPVAVTVDVFGHVLALATCSDGTVDDAVIEKRDARTGDVLWRVRHDNPTGGFAFARGIVTDAVGDVYVGIDEQEGLTFGADRYLAKYRASDGVLIWQRRMNTFLRASSYDGVVALALDPDGNLVVLGSSPGADGYDDVHLGLYSSGGGGTIWETSFDSGSTWGDGAPSDLAVSFDGRIAVAASVRTPSANRDILTLQFDGVSGALLWQRTYNSPAGHEDFPSGITFDAFGDVVVAGTSSQGNGLTGFTALDIHAVKYAAATGATLWQTVHAPSPNQFERADFLAPDPYGNVIIGGLSAPSYSDASAYGRMLVLKLAGGTGAVSWAFQGSALQSRGVTSLLVDGGGTTYFAGIDYSTPGSTHFIEVMSLAESGAAGFIDSLVSNRTLSLSLYDQPLMARTSGGNLALFARNKRGTAGTDDGFIALLVINPFAEIAADASSVTVYEGSPAQMTGTFSHASGNSTVNFSASIGTIVEDDATGTWLWSHTPTAGADSMPVTIYAYDGTNPPVTLQFTLNVANVLPSFEAGPTAALGPETLGQFFRGPIVLSDPGQDAWSGTVDFGDGSPARPLWIDPVARSFPLVHTFPRSGTFTVTVSLQDEAGIPVQDTFTVSVDVSAQPVTSAVLHGIGDLPGGMTTSTVRDATKVGSVIFAVGSTSTRTSTNGVDTAVLWRSSTGMTALPDLVFPASGNPTITASAITPNGAFIASRARNGAGALGRSAVRVTSADLSVLDLRRAPFTGLSAANAISADCSVIAGFGQNTITGRMEAFRYDATSHSVIAIGPLLPGDDESSVVGRGLSADGSVIAGTSIDNDLDGFDYHGPGNRAFRYLHGAGASAIPLPPGGTWSFALALSPDGRYTLFAGDSPASAEGELFLHNAALGTVRPLGTPNPALRPSNLAGMSANGAIIVAAFFDPVSGHSESHVRTSTGWRSLEMAASAAGVDLAGWSLGNVIGISPDATLVWGSGFHNGIIEGFVIEFPPGFLANLDGFALHSIGDLPGGAFFSEVRDATKVDGLILAVGGSSSLTGSSFGDRSVLWSSVDGLRQIPELAVNNSVTAVFASAITPDGRYIAARSRVNPTGSQRRAVRIDTATLTPTVLAEPPGATGSSAALAISDDGSILHGFTQNNSRAVRYTVDGSPGVLVPLVVPGVHTTSFTSGRASSVDGSVSAGSSGPTSAIGPGMRGFRFLNGSTLDVVPLLPGGTWNAAFALSADGRLTLAGGNDPLHPQGAAYIHDATDGTLRALGTPNGSTGFSVLAAMSGDGAVVAGPISGDYIRNGNGWHSLADILAAVGMGGPDWRALSVIGLSRDARLVFGTRIHSGGREGFVAEFPAGFLAGYQEPAVASEPDAAIAGAWMRGAPGSGQAMVCFLPNGWYLNYEIAAPGAPASVASGFERGRYDWQAPFGALTAKSLIDQNGDHGLSTLRNEGEVQLRVYENHLETLEEGTGVVTDRIDRIGGASPLSGAWLRTGAGVHAGDYELLAFLPDGTYVHVREGASAGGGWSGGEHGTYTWDPIAGSVTATTVSDGNGAWGLNSGTHPAVVAGGQLNGTFTRIGREPLEMADWNHMHFTPAQLLDPTVSGPDADPNGDGIPNFLHFALGLGPLDSVRARSGAVATTTLPGQSGTFATFTYTRPEPARADVTYRVLQSTNLTTWTELDPAIHTLSVVPNADGTATVTLRAASALPATGAQYLRLEVVPR